MEECPFGASSPIPGPIRADLIHLNMMTGRIVAEGSVESLEVYAWVEKLDVSYVGTKERKELSGPWIRYGSLARSVCAQFIDLCASKFSTHADVYLPQPLAQSVPCGWFGEC